MTGRTSQQILAAPENALYIVEQPGVPAFFTRDLARALGRRDVVVAPAQYFAATYVKIIKSRRPVIIDHALTDIGGLADMDCALRQRLWKAMEAAEKAGLLILAVGASYK